MSIESQCRSLADQLSAFGADKKQVRDTLRAAAAEIKQLRLSEEGAAEAFGVVVQSKRDLETEVNRLQSLLDSAYALIRRNAQEARIYVEAQIYCWEFNAIKEAILAGRLTLAQEDSAELPMASVEMAISIATKAHAGQVDKAGQPYILHPLRVMMRLKSPFERMAAVLHDVVEDSPVTLEELTAYGFPSEVVEAVDALTKRPGESRIEAAHRASKNPIARAVKLSDNEDNMDLSRIPTPTQKDLLRMEEYKKVREILLIGSQNESI